MQTAPIRVYRDLNQDFERTGDQVFEGLFGVNQHWGFDLTRSDVGRASAGCLGGSPQAGHHDRLSALGGSRSPPGSPAITPARWGPPLDGAPTIASWVEPGTDHVYPLSFSRVPPDARGRGEGASTAPRLGPDVDHYLWRQGRNPGDGGSRGPPHGAPRRAASRPANHRRGSPRHQAGPAGRRRDSSRRPAVRPFATCARGPSSPPASPSRSASARRPRFDIGRRAAPGRRGACAAERPGKVCARADARGKIAAPWKG